VGVLPHYHWPLRHNGSMTREPCPRLAWHVHSERATAARDASMAPMDDDEARELATEWHGGEWSPLYALATTGAIVMGCAEEVGECRRAARAVEPADEGRLARLAAYVDTNGPRAAKKDWPH